MEQIVGNIWQELKRYINVVDRDEAAELLVSILIDNDCDIDDIKEAFGSDKNIKNALTNYRDTDIEPTEEDDEEWAESFDDDE